MSLLVLHPLCQPLVSISRVLAPLYPANQEEGSLGIEERGEKSCLASTVRGSRAEFVQALSPLIVGANLPEAVGSGLRGPTQGVSCATRGLVCHTLTEGSASFKTAGAFDWVCHELPFSAVAQSQAPRNWGIVH